MKNSKIYANDPFQRGILNTVLIAALFLTVTLSPPAYSHGQGAEKSADVATAIAEQKTRAKELTLQLGNLISEYKSAKATESTEIGDKLAALAEERWQLLGEIIENDSAEVLNQALPDDVLDQMPAKAQAFLEQRMELEGELQLLHVDYQDQGKSHYVYLLTTDNGEIYSLHFAKNGLDITSGARIRAKGLALYGIKTRDAGETEGAVALDDADSSLVFLEAGGSKNTGSSGTTTTTLPNTLGAQKTLVILVNFQDNPTQPYTSADAQNMVFGTTSDFFFENSYQQTWLSGDVAGWFNIPIDGAGCDYFSIQTYAEAAASAAGFDLSAYKHLVYAFPQNNACGWSGLSSLGGTPSWTWINSDELKLGLWAHELGHAVGLYHSHSMDCNTTTLGSSCNLYEYGDTLDTMGASSYNYHFNAFQKERLGWLAAGVSPPVTTVIEDGTYTLEPYETSGSGPKALKILKSTDPNTGKRTWYYVQFLQAIGFDAALAGNSNILNGVVIRYGTESNGNSSYLLDMNPGSGSTIYWDWKDPALVAGQTFEDSAAGVSLTTEWVTATEAAVMVHFGGGEPSGQSTVGISTDRSSYSPGQTVTATALVTAGDIPVANATVTFTFSKPNGNVVTATATSGNDGTAKTTLRLRKQDPVGIYQAVGKISMGSATTTFTVQ